MKRGTKGVLGMKRFIAVLLCCAAGLIPSYGALASQQNGEVLERIKDEDIEIVIPQWEPIPIGSESVEVNTEHIIGVEQFIIIQEATREQIEDEERQGGIELVAQLIRCEAGNQPYEGKVAVGCTVWNRVESRKYPNTVYEVIFSGAYDVAKDGEFNHAGWEVTEEDYQAAREAYENRPYDVIYFRTGYYHSYGTPVCQIGDHYFSK